MTQEMHQDLLLKLGEVIGKLEGIEREQKRLADAQITANGRTLKLENRVNQTEQKTTKIVAYALGAGAAGGLFLTLIGLILKVI